MDLKPSSSLSSPSQSSSSEVASPPMETVSNMSELLSLVEKIDKAKGIVVPTSEEVDGTLARWRAQKCSGISKVATVLLGVVASALAQPDDEETENSEEETFCDNSFVVVDDDCDDVPL